MGDLINLRRFRKAKARLAASAYAIEQRSRFGETTAAKNLAEARERRENLLLDGAKLPDVGKESEPRE